MVDLDGLSALLGQFTSDGNENGEKSESVDSAGDGIFGDIDLETIMKLMDAFSQLNSSDKNTELLLALKPHLRSENQAKVDRAIKLMKLMSVFMLLRENGLGDKLF